MKKTSRSTDESGIGLIEIVVAMFLMALVALAFLPFLINSFHATRANTTLATATQLLDKQFDELRRLQPANCAALTTFRNRDDLTLDRVVDTTRNVTLKVQRTFACPTTPSHSGSEKMTITIVNAAGASIAHASTIVFVVP